MSTHMKRVTRRYKTLLPYTLLLLVPPLNAAIAQVAISLQGEVHAARLDRPERVVVGPFRAQQGSAGEASTVGLRAVKWLSTRWGIDGGLALSTNRSWSGSVGFAPESSEVPGFQTRTLFSSATLRARITTPAARWWLVVGAGPALIFHGGTGTSTLTRNTDVGGLVDLGGSLRGSSRMPITLNLHQYLFSSSFVEPYPGQFVGDPYPAGRLPVPS